MERDFKTQLELQKYLKANGNIPIVKSLKGFVLDGRFVIEKALSEGAFGKIYTGHDLNTKSQGIQKPVIIKFTKNHEMNDREYEALRDIQAYSISQKNDSSFIAETYCKGKIMIHDSSLKPTA